MACTEWSGLQCAHAVLHALRPAPLPACLGPHSGVVGLVLGERVGCHHYFLGRVQHCMHLLLRANLSAGAFGPPADTVEPVYPAG